MVKDNRRGRLVLAMCGWLALALLVAPFANAAERGVVLVYDAQGEQAKSATARTALVIGNGSYRGARLKNPVNDATDVAQALRGLGFEVVLSLDVSRRVLKQAMRTFRQRLQRRGGVGLFYYAGHGIQVRGRNYLIPVGADIETEADVEDEAVNAGLVLRYMEEADARLNIVILDACRNNPVARSWRAESRGLVRLELPQGPLGSLLAYSTAPGKVAADGTGRNSPFTTHLLLNLRIAGLDLEDVFKKTRIGVKRDTDGKQIPWSESSLVGDFYFRDPTQTGAETPVTVPKPPKHTPRKAKLTVRSNVYQDKVYINGQEMGSTRLDVELAAGRHTVRVEKEGYLPYEKTVELKAGSNPALRATLSKAPIMVKRAEPVTPKPLAAALAPNTAVVPNTAIVPQKGKTWTEPVTGMEFVWIPPGCFDMGSPQNEQGRTDDERQHRVCVEGFWLGKHEVAVGEFRRFVQSTGYRTEAERTDGCDYWDGEVKKSKNMDWRSPGLVELGFEQNDTHPVTCVSWIDAQAYIDWLNKNTQGGYRLPTEAEWEYAARARTQTAFFWGEDPDDACRYANVADEQNWIGEVYHCRDGYKHMAPVGEFDANGFDLYDMLGNVWEWTCSVYDKDYGGAERDCADKGSSAQRVFRGGGWFSEPWYLRTAYRNGGSPADRHNFVGFRLARTR